MTRPHGTTEKLAARIVDGEMIDWAAAEASCTSEEEKAFVRNLRIVADVARKSDSHALQAPGATPGIESRPSAGRYLTPVDPAE